MALLINVSDKTAVTDSISINPGIFVRSDSGIGTGSISVTVAIGDVLVVLATGYTNGGVSNPTATYNGVAMTRVLFVDSGPFGGLPGTAIFILTNPAVGTNSVLVSGFVDASTPTLALAMANVDSLNPIDTFNTQIGNFTFASIPLTTNYNDSFLLDAMATVSNIITPGAGQTQIDQALFALRNYYFAVSDMSAGLAGSYSMSESVPNDASAYYAYAAVALKLRVPLLVNKSDTTIMSDFENIGPLIPILFPAVSDTTVMSDIGTVGIVEVYENDLAALVAISGYKWLTQTLYKAQQQFTTRPWFTLKVIDDSIDATGNSLSGVAPAAWGSASKTPDDNIVAAGFTFGFNSIQFVKGRNIVNGWDSTHTLDSNAAQITPTGGQINQVQIAVSDYWNGSYHIDVAYLTNFDGSLGADLILNLWGSDDGGNTWYLNQFTLTDMPYNSLPSNLYIALMKPRLVGGVMTSGFIYLSPNGMMNSGYEAYNLRYSLYPNQEVFTWDGNINSQDWTIHSFDTFYLNGVDYIVFSGFRNILDSPTPESATQNPNYELWVTTCLRRANSVTTEQVWTPPTLVFPANANTPNNQNQYIFPKASVQNGFVDLVFKSVNTVSVSTTAQGSNSTSTTTQDTYMHSQSQDGIHFSYPEILVNINGNPIVESTVDTQLQSYVKQDNFYYLCGGDQIYQFIKNNITADLSADIIGYQVQEIAGQANSITVQVANQNNQWVGSSPTNPGASAITRNSKILLEQGYYNTSGIPEAAPKNVFFIDDIQQNITGNSNDLTLVGRDLFKKLIVLVTKFALTLIAPYFYSDIFDGTSLSNWNQESGSWSESGNQLIAAASSNTTESIAILINTQQPTNTSLMVVNVGYIGTIAGSGAEIYLIYWDAGTYIRLDIWYENSSTIQWQISVAVNGGISPIYTGTFPVTPSNWTSGNVGLVIRQYDYYKFAILVSGGGVSFVDNPLSAWTNAQYLRTTSGGGSNGVFDMTAFFQVNPSFQKPWAVGVGTTPGSSSTVADQIAFSYFQYVQFGSLNDILSISQAMGSLAGVFSQFNSPAVAPNPTVSTIAQQQFVELLYQPNFTVLAGSYFVQNRILILQPNAAVIDPDTTKYVSNGRITFQAKVSTLNSSPCGFTFSFRGSGSGASYDTYVFRVYQSQPATGYFGCRFERVSNGATVGIFPNVLGDSPFYSQAGESLNFDITQFHTYQISMVDGWLYAHIDGIMVAAWNDDNTDLPYLANGFWGFGSDDSNSIVYVKNISSPNFWKSVQTFTFNPGDDAENAILGLVQSIRGWMFSDLLGRMKFIQLSPNDQPNFTYGGQLWQQQVDDSDKEYISQVTVYGTGVMATAQNTNLMAGVPVRDAVIVDYTITTQSDAQTRANNELLNFNQYLNQYEPTEVLNPGSELFDVVVVENTGNNTSGVNSPTRIYSQTANEGGGSNRGEYSISIQTGNV